MQIISLFPTGVGCFQLDRDIKKTEFNFVKKLERRNNTGNFTSLENYVFNNKQLKSLHKFCLDSANTYFKELWKPKEELQIYITQSWINYTSKGQFHHKHAHPNSFISGVFYLNANETSDKIHFVYEKYRQIKVFPTEYNVFNSDSWWLPVNSGKLLLFPSSLEHMVETVTCEDERISLSFNTFLKGPIGQNETLTELII